TILKENILFSIPSCLGYWHTLVLKINVRLLSPPVHYLKPSIVASPSTEISVGQDWILHCWAPFSGVSFVFYQARDFRYEVTPQGNSNMAEFSLKNVSKTDEGRYTCYYHSLTDPVIWSNASNPVALKCRAGISHLCSTTMG
uniref:Ig-like domain-containing protein n=1 Tax=Pseudonaja textilis TaxID=8673 RepID=A0A670YZ21_PSETE